jgi:hypothetical protein
MLPPSWKSEVQKAVEETATADKNQREARQNEASAKIATAINSLRDAQAAQTNSEDTNEKKNQGINKATLVLVAFTVLFTGLSWLVFRDQAHTLRDQLDSFEREAHIRLRAYLSIVLPAPPVLIAGKERELQIVIQSGGQTPAIDLSGWSLSSVGPYPLPDSMAFPERSVENKASVNPGNTIALIVKALPVEQVTVDDIKIKQTKRSYVWGRVNFTDVFGCKRWNTYCFSIHAYPV